MQGPTCGDSGGRNGQGQPCASQIGLSAENGLCPYHDPERAEWLRLRQAEGGRATHRKRRQAKAAIPEAAPKAPRTLADAVRIASWITRATLIGDIDVRVSEAATKACRQFQLSVEKRDLEREIEQLRAELAEAKRSRGPRAV